MHNCTFGMIGLGICGVVFVAAAGLAHGQDSKPTSAIPAAMPRAAPAFKLEDNFLQWPLPTDEDRVYGVIDGRHLHKYVVEQALISRKYRDTVHPQWWGRIIGTSGDKESADWMAAKFKQIGLSGVHTQPIDLPPQWFPDQWTITATSGAQSLPLDGSATPGYGSVGTSADGVDLEAVWVGTGTETDYVGKDIRGKAVFISSSPLPHSGFTSAAEDGAVYMAETKGAAAIFVVITLPGNMRNVLYPYRLKVPIFSLGMEDGYAMRGMIEKAGNKPPRVKIGMGTRMVPDLKTALVWGTLPGTNDETVYVLAHRDGWFDAAMDNGSGVATMLGLAEYFAKIPQAQRRRTIVFVGLDGHHNDGGAGRTWMTDNKDKLFSKTALMINAEHTSSIQTYLGAWQIRHANMSSAYKWYAGGPSRPEFQNIAVTAFRKFGVPLYAEPEAKPLGDINAFYRFLPGIQIGPESMYFHSDAETPETIPWTGLEASTRAYAKIIDEVNKLSLSDFRRPEEPAGVRPCREPRAFCYTAR